MHTENYLTNKADVTICRMANLYTDACNNIYKLAVLYALKYYRNTFVGSETNDIEKYTASNNR